MFINTYAILLTVTAEEDDLWSGFALLALSDQQSSLASLQHQLTDNQKELRLLSDIVSINEIMR